MSQGKLFIRNFWGTVMKQLHKAQDTGSVGVSVLLLHTITSTCCSSMHVLQGGRKSEVWNMTSYPWVSGLWSSKDRVTPCSMNYAPCKVHLKYEYDTFLRKVGNYLPSDAVSKPRKTVPDCVAVNNSELPIYKYLPLNREGGPLNMFLGICHKNHVGR